MGDRAQLGGEPDRVGRVFGLALDEQRLDREPQAEPARHVAHLPQRRALDPVQPVELMRGPRRDHARMVDQHRGTDRGRQLQVRPAHRLVELEVGLVHEVDGQRAVGRVAQAPPAHRSPPAAAAARAAPARRRSGRPRTAQARRGWRRHPRSGPAPDRDRTGRGARRWWRNRRPRSAARSRWASPQLPSPSMRLLMSLILGLRRVEPGQHLLPGGTGVALAAVLQGADAQEPPDLGIVRLQAGGLGQELVGPVVDRRQARRRPAPGRPAAWRSP